MDISNLFDANWWTSPGGKAPISTAREEIEPVIAPMRNGTGSLDPANVTPEFLKKYGVSPSAAPDVKEIVGLGKMRADAMRDTYKAPELSPLQFLASAVSAASVPVAYAQGNRSFAQAMTGKTLADQHNQRVKDYEDAGVQAQQGVLSGTFDNIDKTVSGIQQTRRERQQKMLDAASLLVARKKHKEAIELLRSNGLDDYATALEERVKTMPADPATPTTPAAAPPSAPQPVSGPVPTDGPGRFAAPGLTAPAPAAPAGPPPTPSVYQTPPEVQKLYDDAQMAAIYDPATGKSLLEQAQIADRAAADAWKSRIDSETNSRNGRYSVQTTWLRDKDGKLVAGQVGPRGEIIKSQVPEGYEAFDPVAMAAAKAFEKESGKTQGEAQGKAASNLPLYEQSADFMDEALGKLIMDPNLSRMTGPLQGHLPNVTGDSQTTQSFIDQVQGKTFLQAFNDLRGGGAITEKEGEKATAAYNRLSKLTVNDGAYLAALQDFKREVQALREVARQKATAGLIRPGTNKVDIGRGQTLYKHSDGHWRSELEAPADPSAPRPSSDSRISIQRIE
jgi:hypothetical protein